MVHLLRSPASEKQISSMLEDLETYIKLAVDVKRGILAGGGTLHADCEEILIEDGSKQEFIWGADWIPSTQEIRYEALINLRPRHNNRSMRILDPEVRTKVAEIVGKLLEGK
jgi:hypothetical protein